MLREATLARLIEPVLCGSALDGIGVQPLLDAVAHYLPSPADVPPVEGIDPKKPDGRRITRKPDPDEPFCGLVFKIVADKHGDLYYVRVYSGELKANSRVLQPGQGQEGKRAAALADPGRSPRAGADRSRPATSSASSACGTRSPATRSATRSTRSCWSRSTSPKRSSRWPSSRRARPSARSSPTRSR